jgi:uncharacterized protein (DUF1330 family)
MSSLSQKSFREDLVKTHVIAGAAMLAGFGIGAFTIEELHAQAKPPAYVISEIDMTNSEAYVKDYVPLAQKALHESGQKVLASGGRTAALAGEPPKTRIVLSMFETMEKAQAAYTSYLHRRRRSAMMQ